MFKTIFQLNESRGFIVSEIDSDLLRKHIWSYKNGKYKYGRRLVTIEPGVYKQQLLHQVIAKRMFDDISGHDIDHINRDVLDNRRENLRLVSRSINKHNSVFREDVGVYQLPSGSWIAVLNKRNRVHYGGAFATKEEAKAKRRSMELGYIGHLLERQ